MKKISQAFTWSVLLGLLITSCVKQDFDRPPIATIPVGTVVTIAELRQMFADSGEFTFTTDYSVYATVTMDESSDNIYKNAYIQDPTGAINLHFQEPGGLRIGDSIRVYLRNCILSEYSELLQVDNVHNDSSIVIIANEKYLQPEMVTIPGILAGDFEAKLVKLDEVQFAEFELGKNYAEEDESTNRMLEDCDFNSVIVRTSSYANFAHDPLPEGKGSMIAIVGRYNDDWQLYIRTIDEVNLTGVRCDGGGGDLEQVSIAEVRAMYTGSPLNLPAGKKIVGVITSDKDNNNLPGKNAFIQETSGAGIALRFTDFHDLPMGAQVEINISDQELSEFNGLLQINNLPLGYAVNTGTGTLPTPADLTISDLLADFDNYESMLIRLSDVLISSPGGYTTYKYNTELNDGTGTIGMFTQDYANFANDEFPTDTVQITAIASVYNDPQVLIRNLDDVVVTGGGGGGGGGTTVTSIDEDFQTQVDYEDVEIEGWLNTATTGSRNWLAREYSGNLFPQATSYNAGESNIMWLITPKIDLDAMTNPRFEFESAQAFWVHDGMTVYISSDFDGTNINDATWEELPATLAGQNNANYDWVPSGVLDLSSYSGYAYIGFKYEGSDPGQTTSYRIDNVKLYDE